MADQAGPGTRAYTNDVELLWGLGSLSGLLSGLPPIVICSDRTARETIYQPGVADPPGLFWNPDIARAVGSDRPVSGGNYHLSWPPQPAQSASSMGPVDVSDLVVCLGDRGCGLSDAVSSLLHLTENIDDDFFSHSKDHSIEVQIPMLQTVFPNNLKILPIILAKQDIDTANEIGTAIAEIAKTLKLIIIGSSDFTHYEENTFAHQQDEALIEPILKLDVEEFYSVLKTKNVSACGYGAIASTMVACKKLGATSGELLAYATSGDVVGNKESVVGYGSIKFV